MYRLLLILHYLLTAPVSIFFILTSRAIHPAYRLSWFGKMCLGWRMALNKLRIRTGTSYKSHLAMALKILETPPDVAGDIVECGTWRGGSAVNLSMIAKLTGRRLLIFDSFEGLPEGDETDRQAFYETGDYCGSIEDVKSNITRFG